jgi:hypothetical protein
MKLFGLRPHIVIIALILTLSLLLGGNYVYQKYRVDRSLVQLYDDQTCVEGVAVERSSSQTTLRLSLARVDNLRETYRELQTLAETVVPPDQLDLELADRRSDRLQAAFHDVHLQVFEAASTGRFSLLEGISTELAEEWGLSHVLISTDGHRIYVQLHNGEHYLYEVVPMQQFNLKGGTQTR